MGELASASEALPPIPEGMKLYRLSVKTRRVITTAPVKEAQTVEAEWVIGDLPGVNEMHVRQVYWKNCPHKKPALLDRVGLPLASGRIKKIGEIIVRLAPAKIA